MKQINIIILASLIGLIIACTAYVVMCNSHEDVNNVVLSEDTNEFNIVKITEGNDKYTYSIDLSSKQAKLLKLESNEQEVHIPSKIYYDGEEYVVVSIEKQAVYCPEAKEILIESEGGVINEQAFEYCNKLEKARLNGITEIGPYAFSACRELSDVSIVGTDITLGLCSFESCGLVNFSCMSDTISIGDGVFKNNWQLTDVIISGSITELGNSSFYGCGFTTLHLNFEDEVCIGDNAFKRCTYLKDAEFRGDVVKVGEYAFLDCSNLKSISFEEGLKSVAYGAFNGCTSLKYVYLPNTLDNIDKYAFWNCTALETLIIDGNQNVSISEGAFTNAFSADLYKTFLRIPVSSLDDLHEYGVKDGVNICVVIPNDVTHVSNGAFQGCFDIVEIIFHERITLIGDSAFKDCVALTSIIIPEGIREIGSFAFYNCTNINSIVISKTVEKIGNSAFSNISKLQSICFLNKLVLPKMPEVQSYNENSIFYGDEDCIVYLHSSINESALKSQIKNAENIEKYDGCVVTLDPNGGTLNQIFEFVECGKTITQPKIPSHSNNGYNYEFLGWYLDDKKYDFSTPITDDIQLTAMWNQIIKEEQDSMIYIATALLVSIIIVISLLVYFRMKNV